MLHHIIFYLKKRLFLSFIGGYYAAAIFLYKIFHMDIFIPCLNRTITGKPCLSCGINRSLLCIIEGNITQAYQLNPLILFILPILFLLIVLDYHQVIQHKMRSN
jgi:Protein of unknown function (DUF2752)